MTPLCCLLCLQSGFWPVEGCHPRSFAILVFTTPQPPVSGADVWLISPSQPVNRSPSPSVSAVNFDGPASYPLGDLR